MRGDEGHRLRSVHLIVILWRQFGRVQLHEDAEVVVDIPLNAIKKKNVIGSVIYKVMQ